MEPDIRDETAAGAGDGEDGWVDLGPLTDYLGFHLRRAQEASFRAFTRRDGKSDLTPGRFAALVIVGANPGITQTALSRAIGRDKSSMTPVMEDLVKQGLVERHRFPADRRSYALRLTAAGETLVRRLRASAEEHERSLDRIVGAENRAEFLRILRHIAFALA